MGDQAIVLSRLIDFDPLALHKISVFAAAHARPGNTEMGQLANCDGCLIRENIRDFLVCSPVGPTYGVEKMHVRTVALRFDAIAQRRLHTTLCRAAVTAPWWHQRQNHCLLARCCRFNSAAFAGKTATNDKYVGRYQLRRHDAAPLMRNSSGGATQPARTSSVSDPSPSTSQKITCSIRCRIRRCGTKPAPHLMSNRYNPTLA